MNPRTLLIIAIALILSALVTAGCSAKPEPSLDARKAVGTIVRISTYPTEDAQDAHLRVVDDAYAEMLAVEAALNVHDPDSAIARVNAGEGALPQEAADTLAAIERLGVGEYFSPYLLRVMESYDFEGGGRVPASAELKAALTDRGYDFGGAAKGLALDQAARRLAASPHIEAALVTAGSTTLTIGEKPDGSPWRIGIEHPRDTATTFASITTRSRISVSTSGDYQRYFVREGARYHHIIDPETGRPAQGLRSLTVVGEISGLDSDILSTALFVMGPDRAAAYARRHGLGLVMMLDSGQVQIVQAPPGADWLIDKRE